MQFSLKKYITEKYLTERLQSDTVIHDILNDKGKMFTYYKQPYPGTMYKKALDQFKILNDIIYNLIFYKLSIYFLQITSL